MTDNLDRPLALVVILLALAWIVGGTLAHLYRTRPRRTLQATDHGGVTMAVPVPDGLTAAFSADQGRRLISGMVLPYGEVGHTSAGALTAGPGSVRLPLDLSRVKLVDYHQQPPRAVGYAVEATESPEGLRMSFRVGTTPEGDRALLEASERLADAFSVELHELVTAGDHISDSLLTAVALLGVPAFPSARVAEVAAALTTTTTTEGTTMTEEQRARLLELLALNQRTPEQETEYQQLLLLAAQDATGDQQQQPADQQQQQPQQAAAGRSPVVTQPRTPALAAVPAGLSAGMVTPGPRPLRDLFAAMARVASGQSSPDMEAALSDITQTGMASATPDQYAGQLWSGLDYTRRFVGLMQSGELTSWRGTGWRWVVEPEVADYAGDKAPVPSNAATIEDEPWVAARLAGAHDIDRKFRDFGDSEFMDAYYHAMTMSYARKSDAKARDFVIANATAGAAITGDLLTAVATVVDRVQDATDGASADYVLVNNADRLGLLNVSASQVPAFLELWGIQPGQFIGTSAVPAGTVIAGNRNASEFKELPSSPIRVETVNIANGGIDGGVFGYYATLLHDQAGIQKATFA